MAKNDTNNFKPSMRKLKEALAIKAARRKAITMALRLLVLGRSDRDPDVSFR